MKASLSALVALCAGTLAVAQQSGQLDTRKPANAASLDGSWAVVSAEKNGQPMPDARDMTVTVKDNTITCTGKDGKPAMTLKVDFAGPGHARVPDTSSAVTAGGGNDPARGAAADTRMAREAVYVMTSDYLAVCVHDSKGVAAGGTELGKCNDPARGTGASTGNQPSAHSFCTLILKRAGTTDRR